MLRQNRSMQSHYDALMELKYINSRKHNIDAQHEYRLKRRRLRSGSDNWSSSDEDEGHNGIGEQEQHLEAQISTSTRRLNGRLETKLGTRRR